MALLLSLLLTGSVAVAQSGDGPKANDSTASRPSVSKSDRGQPKPERKTTLSQRELLDQEQSALAFAKANFPELAQLVASLKKQQPKEYQKAVRDLHRTADRLAKLQRHDPARHEMELKKWKCQTEIELLMAQCRLPTADKAQLRADLRKALLERHQLQLAALKQEHAKAAERLAKLDKQIQQMDRDHETSVDRLLGKMLPTEKKEAKSDRRPPAARPPKPTRSATDP